MGSPTSIQPPRAQRRRRVPSHEDDPVVNQALFIPPSVMRTEPIEPIDDNIRTE